MVDKHDCMFINSPLTSIELFPQLKKILFYIVHLSLKWHESGFKIIHTNVQHSEPTIHSGQHDLNCFSEICFYAGYGI